MNYSDCELSDDDTQPHPQQGQQNTDQSPSSSTQTTPLGSKGHSTRKCGVQPNRKQKKMSNEPNKKDTKGKRGGSNCSQQQAVNPSHSPSSSSSSSPTTPKNQKKKKKGSKGNSPPRLDPFSPGANTSNLKVSDPISGLQFLLGMTSGSYQRMSSKQQLHQSKDPHHQVSTAVQDVACGTK